MRTLLEGQNIDPSLITNPKLKRTLFNRRDDFLFNHNDKHGDTHTDHHDKAPRYYNPTERYKDYSDYDNHQSAQ